MREDPDLCTLNGNNEGTTEAVLQREFHSGPLGLTPLPFRRLGSLAGTVKPITSTPVRMVSKTIARSEKYVSNIKEHDAAEYSTSRFGNLTRRLTGASGVPFSGSLGLRCLPLQRPGRQSRYRCR